MAKKKKQRKIWSEWIVILASIPIINWIPFLIAGLITKNKKWILFSILYISPLILLPLSILIGGDTESELNDLLLLSIFLLWIIAIIHSTFIAAHFKVLLRKKRENKQNEFNWLTIGERDEIINTLSNYHQSMINKMLDELREINREYHKINSLYQLNFTDIVVMLEGFIDQLIELMKKKEQIDKTIKRISVSEIESKIKELSDKIKNTDIKEFKDEYYTTIDHYTKRKNTCTGFVDIKKQIDLKLKSYLEEFKKIKQIFLKLDFSAPNEKKDIIEKRIKNLMQDIKLQINTLSDTLELLSTTIS